MKPASRILSSSLPDRKKNANCILFAAIFTLCICSFCANKSNSDKVSPVFAEPETERPGVVIISVFDNYRINPDLKTAWGFGSVIKTPSETLLFDTGGDSDILLSNMQKMDIDPGSIDKVIISHAHGDHVDGLAGFLDKNNHVSVFVLESFPNSIKNMISNKGAELIEVSGPIKISDYFYSTGELKGPPEEQSIIIDSKKGLIVMTGCAHPGIVNIVKKTKELINNNLYLVMGGFHRPPVSVVQKFRELGVEKVAPSHCTGDQVRDAFAQEYKEDYVEYGVGKIIEIK
jgi:7,8-dihydropterin-6-yl-methyl-4-(beta-D-ribofuranosyl)aminobenzene 5'-phosphate synthase